jgi:hypothetical protein
MSTVAIRGRRAGGTRALSETLIRPADDEITERFDAIACLDERIRHTRPVEPVAPGRYIEVQGPDRSLLIALGTKVIHIGRGLAADLRLDDSSVSRRHAVLVPWLSGHRILDDRSSNGTFVNGRRVEQSDIRDGDEIMLGRVVLRYLEHDPRGSSLAGTAAGSRPSRRLPHGLHREAAGMDSRGASTARTATRG